MGRHLLLLPVCLLLHGTQARMSEVTPPERSDRQVVIADKHAVEKLLRDNPIAGLRLALERYDREVRGYTCVLSKTERMDGVLRTPEEIDCCFKENPHSVYMHWKKGARLAAKALFVRGQNDDQLLALPAGILGFAGVQYRSLDSADSTSSGRYLINEFGIRFGAARTLDNIEKAKKAGGLISVRYEGIFEVPQLDNRRCYKLVRKIDPPQESGSSEAVIYIDVETFLQTGTVLRAADGSLVGEYYFRDVRLNPTFPPEQFQKSAL